MGSKQEIVVIYNSAAVPTGGEVSKSKAEIETLLKDTNPTAIDNAGFAYGYASGSVELLAGALQDSAKALSEAWKGDTSATVQKAMQLMNATGTELASKMKEMGTALRLYADAVPKSLAKVQGIQVELKPTQEENTGGGTSGYSESVAAQTNSYIPASAKQHSEDVQARKILKELNEKISDIFYINVPYSVTYEVPTVTIPGGGPDQKQITYQKTSDSDGWKPGAYTPVEGSSNSHGTTGGSHDSTTRPGDDTSGDHTGGKDHGGGKDQDGTTGSDHSGGKDGSDGGGDQSGDSDQGTNPDGSTSDTPSADQSRGDTSSQNHDRDTTVPSVIDHNPRQSEVASFQPTNTTATPYSPNTLLTPTGGTPSSVPSVLGGPTAASGGALAGLRGGAAGTGMMPFMPMGGMGGEGEGTERTTDLSEDPDTWATTHSVTEPRIG